ncbi:Uncharacterised protein [Cedecea lapagei]|uniref:N-acetyltransferase domain-containing protein n=1 Tax=Cedecea lapagei TaxID=158823 RepID=A0A3S5DPQ8_9ENTR|nr:GNAT family N-acetyltransferase [Cedecea lapagei]VEB97638.1 Uncharacterised protein [Cedecea lapagei]
MIQTTLNTGRLKLIPLAEAHLNHQIAMDADKDVMRYLGGPQDANSCRTELAEVIAASERGLGYWAGFMEDDFVGFWILCVPYEVETQPPGENYGSETGELGYRLMKKFWRQGLGTEGSLALIEYGFNAVGLQQIISRTSLDNIGSQATMRAAGLHFKRHFAMDDEQGVEYQLTEQQWRTARE